LNYTVSEENYLKTIFHLQTIEGNVSTNTLAGKLQTKPASVTDMMKKLNSKKLLHYKPYYGFSLSSEGKKIALAIIRRHRLWEYFLAEKLKFEWHQIHSIAEQLEHINSSELIDRLDEYLGYPTFDPHGDPIPDRRGRIISTKRIPLNQLPLLQPAEVVQVTNQEPALLDILNHKKIGIKTILKIQKRFGFDHSMEILVQDRVETISETLAKHIMVTYEHDNLR
jgi:DtxR family transcriptional regulator, Mn-dependent transcriptional regulator